MDFEHRASEQIPLLLKLGQEPQALTKAVESGDPNLIYYVLVVMKENYSADKFYMTIRHYPSVNALYAKLCRTVQMGSLEQIYEQEDNFNAQAILSVRDSYRAQVRFKSRLFSNEALLIHFSVCVFRNLRIGLQC